MERKKSLNISFTEKEREEIIQKANKIGLHPASLVRFVTLKYVREESQE